MKSSNATFVALAALFWIATSTIAQADTVVLVQGYLGSANSWRASGIGASLHRAGWADAGHLSATPSGGILHYGPRARSARRFYTIDIATEAPIEVQATMLARYVAFIQQQHRGEPVILVGHSAGGIAARYLMVTNRFTPIAALITIAAPHLGTQLAEMGAAVADSPLGWMAPMFGAGTINRSRRLYYELSPERPGSLLGWLNRQPHPPAQYISIIRVRDVRAPHQGDNLVYGWSQDMNTVPALRGRARTVFSPGTHALRPADGILLANILNGLKLAKPPAR